MCESCELGIKVIEASRTAEESSRIQAALKAMDEQKKKDAEIWLSERLTLADVKRELDTYLEIHPSALASGLFPYNFAAWMYECGRLAGRQEENEAAV